MDAPRSGPMKRGWGYTRHNRVLKQVGVEQVEAQNTCAAFWAESSAQGGIVYRWKSDP